MKSRNQKEGSEVWFYEAPVEEINQRIIDWGKEEFEMVIEDLYHLPGNKHIIVAAFPWITELVYKMISPQKVIFMVAEEEFQRYVWSKREWVKEGLKAISNPKRNLEKFIDIHIELTKNIVENVRKIGGKLIITDKDSSIEKNIEIITIPSPNL